MHHAAERRSPLAPQIDNRPSDDGRDGRRNTGALLALLGGVALFAVVVLLALIRAETWDQVLELLTIVLPVALLGAGLAVGYLVGRTGR